MRIRWVKVWVDAMASLTERFRDEEGRVDFEALGREEYAFRHALVTGDFSRSERARDLYDATINEITSRSEAGRKGAEARWNKNTAAATHREAVDVSANGCNPSSADAPTREDGDERQHPSDGELLESGTSANHYDQETDQVSTKALDKPGAGEVPPESVSAKPSPALPVPAKKAHGEFGNVLLTDDEFAKLQEKTPNAWDLITELDQYIESQGKTKKYKSHYATLLNWSRRKATEAKQPSRYKNINDINRENCEQIERDLRAMFHPEEVI
jgi:hypothetical protein